MKRVWLGLLISIVLGLTPLTLAQTPADAPAAQTLTPEELAEYTGKDGKPAYIAVDGVVYDVTGVSHWAGGEHNGFAAGKEVSNALRTFAPHGLEMFEGVPVVGQLAEAGAAPVQEATRWQQLRPSFVTFLGVLSLLLVLTAVELFAFRRFNKYAFSNQNPGLKRLVKIFSKYHPKVGIALVIVALAHGYLALGTIFKLHTGPLAWAVLVLMMLVVVIGKQYRLKWWLKVHRSLAIVFIVALFVHLFARNVL